jgi:hypothetical protein
MPTLSAFYDEHTSEGFTIIAIEAGDPVEGVSQFAQSYGLKFPVDDPPAPDVLNFRRVELIRQIMVDHGDGGKNIYITESGCNDHPRWTKAVRPGQRITYTVDAFNYVEANWPWAERLCIWALRDPAPTSFPDYYTLITPDFTLKPSTIAWARSEASWISDAMGMGRRARLSILQLR